MVNLDGKRSVKAAQRGTVAFGVLGKFATLCRLGLGLGGPRVAQGPPKRGAREAQAWIQGSALLATKAEKMAGVGVAAVTGRGRKQFHL